MAFTAAWLSCVPDVFIASLVRGLGWNPEDFNEAERLCLREAFLDVDWEAVAGGAEFVLALLSWVPDVLISLALLANGLTFDDLGEEGRLCLREMIRGIDFDAASSDSSAVEAEFHAGMASCLVAVPVSPAVVQPVPTGTAR